MFFPRYICIFGQSNCDLHMLWLAIKCLIGIIFPRMIKFNWTSYNKIVSIFARHIIEFQRKSSLFRSAFLIKIKRNGYFFHSNWRICNNCNETRLTASQFPFFMIDNRMWLTEIEKILNSSIMNVTWKYSLVVFFWQEWIYNKINDKWSFESAFNSFAFPYVNAVSHEIHILCHR